MNYFDCIIALGGFLGGLPAGAFGWYVILDGDPRVIQQIPIAAAVMAIVLSAFTLAFIGRIYVRRRLRS